MIKYLSSSWKAGDSLILPQLFPAFPNRNFVCHLNVLHIKKEAIKGFFFYMVPLSWICFTLTECHFRYYVPVNDICSLPEFHFVQYVRKSAKRKLFVVFLHINKKNTQRVFFLFIWYPQANSNRCLHRERVLS